MGKKPTRKGGKGGKGKPAKPASTTGLMNETDGRYILGRCRALQSKASSHTGDMGKLIRDYEEKKNLHRGAFAIARRWDRLGRSDPSKLWLEKAHLDHYWKILGFEELAGSQGQMFDAKGEPVVETEEPKREKGQPDLKIVSEAIAAAE